MEQKIESKVEAKEVKAPVKEAKAQAPMDKQVKKETKEVPTAQTEDIKPMFVKKKSQFSDYKLFNKWSYADVVVTDLSLIRYINLDPMVMPHSFGRKTRGRFEKQNLNIVERLTNKVMRSGQGKRKLSGKFIRGRGSCGKKLEAMAIVEKAFTIIEKQTKQNPIQVLVRAIENSAPREDVTRIKRGGVAYALAVDLAPLKRLDEAVKNLSLGGFAGSFNKKVSAQQALADEIIAAANNDLKSSSVKRKDEVERIAKASR
jgi:small subunit ribosomal protein S7